MARPWRTVDSVDTDEGFFDLRQRGEMDFLITIDGRVLMNASDTVSEMVLAELACESLRAGGILAVWSEDSDKAFEKRLKIAGFSANRQRPGRGGCRHVVYIARKTSDPHSGGTGKWVPASKQA